MCISRKYRKWDLTSLVASVSGRWPYNYRVQIPTVAADVFDRCDYLALHTCASIASHVVLTY
jgi:hypothetical protein